MFALKNENQKVKLEDIVPKNNESHVDQNKKSFTIEVSGMDSLGRNLFKKQKEAN